MYISLCSALQCLISNLLDKVSTTYVSYSGFTLTTTLHGARGGAVGRTVLQAGRSQVRFMMESLEFFRPQYGPGVYSDS
jgi:hypothetical protein